MQSAAKIEATRQEKLLKATGQDKFKIAQELTGGRDFLDKLSERDTTARDTEKLRAQQAVALGQTDIEDSAEIGFTDTRNSANSGVAAKAASDENRFSATGAILDADLAKTSTVSASERSLAQSALQVAETNARSKMNDGAIINNILGTAAGATATAYGAGLFENTDPLANPNQVAPNLKTAVDAPINNNGFYDPFAAARPNQRSLA
jgi:hypothetical protein